MKKVICVTGGSDGIGRAIAEHFSKEYTIVALARSEEKLKTLQREFGVKGYVLDVTDSCQVEDVMSHIIAENNGIDVLINAAGVLLSGELADVSFDEIKTMIDTNLTGLINTTKAVSSCMKEKKAGLIININSQAGIGSGMSGFSLYNASKWGVTGFSKCLQTELAKYKIKVTDVFLGRTDTNIFQKAGLERDMSKALKTSDVVKTIEFLLNLPDDVVVPEISIKNINN